MKSAFIFLLLAANCMLLATAFTPKPPLPAKCFNYQAIVRGSNGQPLQDKKIALKISFIQDTLGPMTYIETHTAMTNQFGLVNLQVGCGTALSGSFDALNWGAHDYWLKIEIDSAGGSNFVSLSESKLLAVPVARWAEHSSDWVNVGDTVLYSPIQRIGNTPNPRYGLELNGDDGLGKIWLEEPYPSVRFKNTSNTGNFLWQLSNGGDFYIYDSKYQNYRFIVQKETGNVGIGTTIPQTQLDVNGTTRTKILEITGGDVAEARHSTTGLKFPAGSVVIFDENERGKIRLTSQPYDKKVAGVISGAGKYFAGVCLLQEELAKGAMPVAQLGTVEVLCVGPVRVGDLLTTSNVEGHAMAVRNPLRSIGCTIGKAMTSLEKGERGLVEMQVEKH